MSKSIPSLRIFISSPGDVSEERELTKKVLKRLQGVHSGLLELKPIFWEHEPLLATQTFQEQITRPSETDIVITILWSRLGTRLPAQFTKEDGSRYESGTEFEFEDALHSFRERGTPDLLIYRKTTDPKVSLKDKKILLDKIKQKEALDTFFDRWFHDKTEGTLIAAFHPFNNSANFEELFEVHLNKLIKNKFPDLANRDKVSRIKPVWDQGSPFRGLDVFNFKHAPVFFGRTKAISEIIDSLRIQSSLEKAFVMVLGRSGGGKSSLVRAGVLPMITQPGVIEGVGLWRRAIMKPGDSSGDLFDNLAVSLLKDKALPELSADGTSFKELSGILKETPKAVVPLIKGGLSQAAAELTKLEKLTKQPNAKLILVIDQMEEMFSLESITQNDRKNFIEILEALSRSGRVWVITTLRSDFYPRTTELETLVALKEGSGQYDLLSPSTAEIGQMIRQPTQAAGLYFEEDPSTNERLDDVLRDAAAKNPSALPLLEFTLEELYKQRTETGMLTYKAYNELGGVEGALAQRAEEVYTSLKPKVQQVMDVELHSLISIGVDDGERISRKYATLEMVTSTPETKAFVESFVEARLFTTDLSADGSATVNIAHEALLRHWPRLQDWVEKNREDLRIHARVHQAALRWEDEKRSREFLLSAGKQISEAEELVKNKSIELADTEKAFVKASVAKQKRIWWFKRAIASLLVVLTIVAIGTAYFAQQQRDRAEKEAKTSEKVSDFMISLFEVSNPSKALGETITAREILDRGAEKIEKELNDQPEIRATLMNTIGIVYYNLDLFDQAINQYEKALEIRKNIYSKDHYKIIQTSSNLALALGNKGEYAKADSLYTKMLMIMEVNSHTDDSLKATVIHNMAINYLDQGDFKHSDSLLNIALTIQREIYGNIHKEVAMTLGDLGIAHLRRYDLNESEKCLREALSIYKIEYGDLHPLIVTTSITLAGLLEDKGEIDEAEKMLRESLINNKKIYENDNTNEVIILNSLAEILRKKGNFLEAEKLHYESLELRKKIFGEEHQKVATTLNNLGLLYKDKGENEKAKLLFHQALEILINFYGNEHPFVASTLYSLSILHVIDEEYKQAEELLIKVVSTDRKLLGADHPYVAMDLYALADVYIEMDQFKEAEVLFLECLNIRVKKLPENHKDIYKTKQRLGYCMLKLERYEDAENYLVESHNFFTKNLEQYDSESQETINKLIQLYKAWNKPNKVKEYEALLDIDQSISKTNN